MYWDHLYYADISQTVDSLEKYETASRQLWLPLTQCLRERNGFLYFYSTFLIGAINYLFTDGNDHAMLIVEIMMKKESAYFTRIAGYMPEWMRLRTSLFYQSSRSQAWPFDFFSTHPSINRLIVILDRCGTMDKTLVRNQKNSPPTFFLWLQIERQLIIKNGQPPDILVGLSEFFPIKTTP